MLCVAAGAFAVPVMAVPVLAGAMVLAVSPALLPQLALRKSLQLMPFSVLAVWAALYFALHSFIVSAFALPAAISKATLQPAAKMADFMMDRMIAVLSDQFDCCRFPPGLN
jgi:hypothetical protein